MDYGVIAHDAMRTSYNINHDLVLYIPHLNKGVNSNFISNIFSRLSIADVNYIHFQTTDALYNAATIYMSKWYNTQCVENLQERINNSTVEARLIYDDPSYWLLFNNANYHVVISLSDRLNVLEESLDQANLCIKTQATEVAWLSKKVEDFEQNSARSKKQYYKNNSCCGAASDGWIPSYPSQTTSWNNRLRPRNAN